MEELTQMLASNLDDLARMSSIVNDIFSGTCRRRPARSRGAPRELRPLMAELWEYDEPETSERGLQLQVDGDLTAAVHEPLVQRAVSNLLYNA